MPNLPINSGTLAKGLAVKEQQLQEHLADQLHTINPIGRREFADTEPGGELSGEFVAPPFSVLDGRSGWWNQRKRRWISLGIRGEEGRDPMESGDRSYRADNYVEAYRSGTEYSEAKPRMTAAPGAGPNSGKGAYLRGGKPYDPKYAEGKAAPKVHGTTDAPAPFVEKGALTGGPCQSIDTNYYQHKKAAEKAGLTYDEYMTRKTHAARGSFVYAAGSGSKAYDGTPGGRGANSAYEDSGEGTTGASVFDPVLTELCYRWFAPFRGSILDPFAGASTRGCVAERCGYRYTGIEIRNTQIEANKRQAQAMGLSPNWILGDSKDLDNLLPKGEQYDLLFTCPPYYNLEVYSENGEDLSTSTSYPDFIRWYITIFKQAVARLRNNRFAVVVVGEIRNPLGNYYGFVPDTIRVLEKECGLWYYNEMILLTPVGSLPVRTGAQFRGSRKVGKTHQNVLVFWKGDLRRIGGSVCRPIRESNLQPPKPKPVSKATVTVRKNPLKPLRKA